MQAIDINTNSADLRGIIDKHCYAAGGATQAAPSSEGKEETIEAFYACHWQ